jgi:hypothetical protein
VSRLAEALIDLQDHPPALVEPEPLPGDMRAIPHCAGAGDRGILSAHSSTPTDTLQKLAGSAPWGPVSPFFVPVVVPVSLGAAGRTWTPAALLCEVCR